MKRQRGRNNNRRNNNNNNSGNNTPNLNRSYDSNGPDVKIRGNASTIYEKYITLARDAKTSGNRVKAESLMQHAEHYLRLNQEIQKKLDVIKAEKDAARLAREEQQRAYNEANAAARQNADQGKESSDEAGDSSESKPRKNTRNSRSRRSREETPSSDAVEKKAVETPSEAEPKVASDPEVKAVSEAPEKPTRRKRAPSRKSEPAPEPAAE